ncbi:GMC oxidoreductase [Colletotrichum graminicola]|uniref:GMC oxidoreductase n=1 Tax=Colletotrichum graminicola (strain M1.001 / M2 / FGSC 10212) TaxID=645133 RepID=E3QYK3_COLGM|nr:GMC oxidoreductase [Colletotrichum graminicola M1.001]EFQ35941.1 GMC oxidoreductase [Colletotrichum graminicola M1.001]WDK16370.1 GMC oxidoreductase [Colletotrichum graminicola]
MRLQQQAVGLMALLAASVQARLLGSSFGIPGADATYDYVVVGGGTAGLTIASRLVEQNAGSVAVVEAGSFYHLTNGNLSQIPGFATAFVGKDASDWQPGADWGYQTTPQAGAFNQSLHYPHGRMLGGSSARNFMVYHRSTAGAYQKWADQVGDQSYAWDNWRPYFEKSLNFTPPRNDLRAANATPQYSHSALGHGDGPLSLGFPNWAYAFPTWATKAFSQMGIRLRKEGFQNGGLLGQAYAMFTIDAGSMLRSSSETSFLQSSLGNTKYYLYPLTNAKKIIFDGNKTATGVQVESLGANFTLRARKEIIVSAGVIGSPQLLQVSGVGPSKILQSLDIPVVVDAPGVGQGMQDHIVFGISQGINAITASSMGNPSFAAQQVDLYHGFPAQGLLTSPAADLLGWEKIPRSARSSWHNSSIAALAAYPADWPEVEYMAFSGYMGNMSVISTADPQDGVAYATMGVVLVAPRSRGSVTIVSTDTAIHPLIDPAFLTAQSDVDVAVGGFKRAREFWQQKSLTPLKVGKERFPGAQVVTDADIETAIRKNFQTIFHGSCTCAMGKKDDPSAVIDTQGRVYGAQGLRVVDASAFPLLPPGHPQSTVYALAEKIACDISGAC